LLPDRGVVAERGRYSGVPRRSARYFYRDAGGAAQCAGDREERPQRTEDRLQWRRRFWGGREQDLYGRWGAQYHRLGHGWRDLQGAYGKHELHEGVVRRTYESRGGKGFPRAGDRGCGCLRRVVGAERADGGHGAQDE